ncbi:MAG: RNA-protein complex protein Nop10 [Methanocalculus sp. MSAO_Arc1]|uniref:RNA-protein complex protein Nop10 n=1 Tax=Methanocalculus TaxID=71151 RepID=UPI000FEFC3CC|nr:MULTISPECIES: RNA-protein complex protein Nop10 [unclassified Methanocalculus]RQD79478.1 MAG: RNA-protein complex protein Nop10 [Methanocalculus sp. MSAO_Arc1]
MKGRIRECPVDGTITLSDQCSVCGGSTRSVHPPRFSPQDRYGRYRRMMKEWIR